MIRLYVLSADSPIALQIKAEGEGVPMHGALEVLSLSAAKDMQIADWHRLIDELESINTTGRKPAPLPSCGICMMVDTRERRETCKRETCGVQTRTPGFILTE